MQQGNFMTPAEQLIRAIIADDEVQTDTLLAVDFKGNSDIASEALVIAIQNKSTNVLPCIAKYCNGNGGLNKLYKEINQLENHLDYADTFSQSISTVFSSFAFSNMSSGEKLRNLEMRLTIDPNYLSKEDGLIEIVSSAGTTFGTFICKDISRFQQLTPYLKITVLEMTLLSGHYHHLNTLFEHMSGIPWDQNISPESTTRGRKRTHLRIYNTHSRSLSRIIDSHIGRSSGGDDVGIFKVLLPLIKKIAGAEEYQKYESKAQKVVLSSNLFSKIGVKLIRNLLSQHSYEDAHIHQIRNAAKAFFSEGKADDEQFKYAREITEILIEHKKTLSKHEHQTLMITRHSLYTELFDDKKLIIRDTGRIMNAFNILFLNNSVVADQLLPEKRKSKLLSAIANLEVEKWRSLAYYYICTNHTFEEYVYKYSSQGIRNTSLARELLSLFSITPYEALDILSDENSQQTLIELISEN